MHVPFAAKGPIMLRMVIAGCVVLAASVALAAEPDDARPEAGPRKTRPGSGDSKNEASPPTPVRPAPVFLPPGGDSAFQESASGSAPAISAGAGVAFHPVPHRGGGNYAIGAGGIYLGGGRYYLPPTRYYHPYFGWSPPVEMYVEPPFPYVPRSTVLFPPLPDLPPREFDPDLPQAPAPELKRGPAAKDVAQVKRLLEFGDLRFREANVVEALRRYKAAVEITPELPEPYFRQGIALAVSGQYERAGESFQKGMALNPNWARDDLRLDDLYGKNTKEKEKDLEKLADLALKMPNRPLPFLLLGMFHHFDGDAQRAAKFLDQANELNRKGNVAPKPGPRKPFIGGVDL